ncbi:MAG: MFS transporter [Sarcina sp.]
MLNFIKAQPDNPNKIPPEKVSGIFKRRQIGVLVATCVTYISYYIIRLIFTTEQVPIMKAYGFSLSQVGIILSMFGIGYGVAKLFSGILSDLSNPKRYLALGLYLSAIFNALLGTTKNFWVILFLMLLIAITQSMGAPACQKLVNVWFSKKSRGTAFNIWSSAHNAGAFLCVTSIEVATILFNGSLSAVFYTASVISVILGTLMLLINSDRPATYGLPTVSEYAHEVEVTAQGEVDNSDLVTKSPWRIFVENILTNKVVWAVTLTSMSIYIVRYGILSWIPSYLPTKGFSQDWAQWLVGIFEISAVPGVIIMGFISDLVKGRRALVTFITTIILGGCLFLYFTSDSKEVITVVLFVMGSTIYAPLAIVGLMVNEAVPKYAVGFSTGFMGFFQYVFGETIATIVISAIAQHYGWSKASYVIFGAVIFALILLLYLTFNERKVIAKERALEN